MFNLYFCRRYKAKQWKETQTQSYVAESPTDEEIYSVAAAVDDSGVIYADIRPASDPNHSIALAEYAQVDKTKKIAQQQSNEATGIARSDSDLVVHENSLYRYAPINKERRESGSDSDEIFEENEVYASSADLHGDVESEASTRKPETSTLQGSGENEMSQNSEAHGYYNLPAQETSLGSGYVNVSVGVKAGAVN